MFFLSASLQNSQIQLFSISDEIKVSFATLNNKLNQFLTVYTNATAKPAAFSTLKSDTTITKDNKNINEQLRAAKNELSKNHNARAWKDEEVNLFNSHLTEFYDNGEVMTVDKKTYY